MKIIKEQTVYQNSLIIEEATIQQAGQTYNRQRINRPDAAAILVENTETNEIILTRQFRYAISGKIEEDLLEIVAGKIDGKDSPEKTAFRETEEEIGYRIQPQNLSLITSCFSSPGYTSEKFYIYYAEVTEADKVSDGGGLPSEHESIEIVKMNTTTFRDLVINGRIMDAKTSLAGLFLILKKK